MSNYNIASIAGILQADSTIVNPEATVKKILIDSRITGDHQTALFFALVNQRDGHDYIEDAYKNGVRNFVVSKYIDYSRFKNANFLTVSDTLKALQNLAAAHRHQFSFPIIGITGSNGKTVVKEWLSQLLGSDYHIVKSPKSFNSQLGVPLSVWQINEQHQLGIFEAGISVSGEMELLQQIIKPTIGILTNLGEAHAGGFSTAQQKLHEKLKLFEGVDLLVYAPDYVFGKIKRDMPGHRKFTWSFHESADLSIVKLEKFSTYTAVHAELYGEELKAIVPFTDMASLENAVICWATLLAMGISTEETIERLSRLSPISMRLQLVNGIENCSVIDDSYSADLSSLAIALDFLHQQNQYTKKTVILSDIVESGKTDEQLYQEVAALLDAKKVNRLIGIGAQISKHQSKFQLDATFFTTTNSFLEWFEASKFSKETILIKGARRFGFERISKLLIQKIHDTVLEINLNALAANVQYYRSKLLPGVKLMAMVKAFSYGSGSFEIANLLQFYKVDYLAVAYADEGIALRKAGISLPIMVMSPEAAAFDAIISNQLEPEIYSLEVLKSFARFASEQPEAYPIHIKLDTGMHRLGFMPEEIPQLTSFLEEHQGVKVVSVLSHLVGSDHSQHDVFSEQQLHLFHQGYQKLVEVLGYRPTRHISNTSAISRLPQAQLDMVRLGIGMYGFDAALPEGELQTVATLKTTITQIKHLHNNETVGYGRKGIMPNDGTIATVKIGYADGYSRAFGNGVGKMLLHGRLVPTIGNICMDMTMIDITRVDATVGDEVIIFNADLSIVTLAEQIKTIPYEILTNISQRVKRVYFYE